MHILFQYMYNFFYYTETASNTFPKSLYYWSKFVGNYKIKSGAY